MSKDEDLRGRTCASCACSYLVEPPKVPTAQQLQDNPALLEAKPVLICRLNPPHTVMTDKGPSVIQQPTMPYMSCWYWLEPGTLPGDSRPIPTGPGMAKSLEVSMDSLKAPLGKPG